MAFNEKELQIIDWASKNGKSRAETEQALLRFRTTGSPSDSKQEQKPSLLSRVATKTGEIFESGRKEIAEETKRAGEQFAQTPKTATGELIEKPAILLRSLFRGAGTTAKTAGKLIAEPVVAGVGAVSERISDIPEVQKFATNPFISSALDTVIEGLSQAGENYEQFSQENPDLARDIEAGTEILLTVLGEKATGEILSKITSQIGKIGRETAEGVGRGFTQIGEGIAEQVPSQISERLGVIPSRIRTNLQTRQIQQRAIGELPTETARTSVRQGIDISDVRFITQEIAEQAENKDVYKRLLQSAKEFEGNPRATNPIEIVGEPLTKRLKELDSQRLKIGQELGKVSDNLGSLTEDELKPVVFGELQKVRGLQGLKLTDKGVLNFEDTVLSTQLTKADRNAINNIFGEAIKAGTGKSKHQLRQELFEILGGKKKSLANITDTQDKAFQAVRKALSDVLETKNETYKELSNQYRKVVQPLSEMRRIMREIPGADEDILDMQAGILARRLTSTAPSNPRIRNTLRQLDQALETTGKTEISVERLQDFYNLLGKYFDIAPATGFKGQIEGALQVKGGVVSQILERLGGITGQTPEVRKESLEQLLESIF